MSCVTLLWRSVHTAVSRRIEKKEVLVEIEILRRSVMKKKVHLADVKYVRQVLLGWSKEKFVNRSIVDQSIGFHRGSIAV